MQQHNLHGCNAANKNIDTPATSRGCGGGKKATSRYPKLQDCQNNDCNPLWVCDPGDHFAAFPTPHPQRNKERGPHVTPVFIAHVCLLVLTVFFLLLPYVYNNKNRSHAIYFSYQTFPFIWQVCIFHYSPRQWGLWMKMCNNMKNDWILLYHTKNKHRNTQVHLQWHSGLLAYTSVAHL